MSVKLMTQEELELISYKDIAALLIKEDGPSKTADLFKFICEGLKYNKKFFESKIGDFYTMLATDKRFVLLEDGSWDLKEKYSRDEIHSNRNSEDEDDEDEDDELLDFEEEDEGDDFDSIDEDDEFVDKDEDLKNLVIIDEEEQD